MNKNPNYCEEGPRKGGYGLKELKEMGAKYFNIDPSMNDKEEICKIIRKKLNDEKFRILKVENYDDEAMYENFNDEESFTLFEKLKNLKTIKKGGRFNKKSSSTKNKTKKKI